VKKGKKRKKKKKVFWTFYPFSSKEETSLPNGKKKQLYWIYSQVKPQLELF
jgi:hypothetical protein